jgi:hypothetical protein
MKKKSTVYSECVFVALDIPQTVLMCHIILSSVAFLPLYFYILSQERHNFLKTVTEHKNVWVDFLCYVYLKYFSFYAEFSEILS